MTNFSRITLGAASLAVLGACEAPREAVSRAAPADAMRVLGYKGIETRLLDGDLVQFVVTMDGEAMPDDVRRYTECAAAQYSLIRGYGFARHLRKNV